jgi:RNA polymerase sigma-70 factor, ECF subfamily
MSMTEFISQASSVTVSDSSGESRDEPLVSAAKCGDHSAFAALCERHSDKIARTIYRITRNWHDAEDVLQEAFLKAFVHLNTFQGRSSFSSWLTRIAINSALMSLRKERGLEIPIDHTGDDLEIWQTWEPRDLKENPENGYVRRETAELLKKAILRLPPLFRDVIRLRHLQDCSTREIAQTLGISVPAAKSRLYRATAVLRASITVTVKAIG